MPQVIRIKPHHFVDIITSFGAGQRTFEPHAYGHGVHSVSERVLRDRDAMLEMETGAADICVPCIHNIDGLCHDTIDTSYRPDAPTSKREWNLIIDGRWCDRLGVRQGDRLSARQFVERLRDLAGDIADIYREEPGHRTADRWRNLQEGVSFFLSAGRADGVD